MSGLSVSSSYRRGNEDDWEEGEEDEDERIVATCQTPLKQAPAEASKDLPNPDNVPAVSRPFPDNLKLT